MWIVYSSESDRMNDMLKIFLMSVWAALTILGIGYLLGTGSMGTASEYAWTFGKVIGYFILMAFVGEVIVKS